MRIFAVLSLIAMSAIAPANAITTAENTTLSNIAAQFGSSIKEGGMLQVGNDIVTCYKNANRNQAKLQVCVLYDISAYRYDRAFWKEFVKSGANPGVTPLFSKTEFDARMNTYGVTAFNDMQTLATLVPATNEIINRAFK